jgi:hypothetical protein
MVYRVLRACWVGFAVAGEKDPDAVGPGISLMHSQLINIITNNQKSIPAVHPH